MEPSRNYTEGPSSSALFFSAAGIIVTILGSAWKVSNDISEFRGSVIQWQIDKEKDISRLQQQMDRVLRP